jgi:phospholipid/cholesterol/gamma-HCH transport system substrate-binding protein
MSDQFKNILIGLFVVVAIVISVSIILFMEPKIGDGKEILHVRFSNISGVTVGAQVKLAGRPVGEVISIKEIQNAREEQTDSLGRVYFYELTLKMDSSAHVYTCDELSIKTTGLLGEKTISITPKAPPKGEKPILVKDKEIIYGKAVDPIESVLHEMAGVAKNISKAVVDFDKWFLENQNNLSGAVTSFEGAMSEIETAIATVNKEELIFSLKDSTDSFGDNMKLLRSALEEMQDNDTIGKLNIILDNFVGTSYSLNSDGRQVLANLNIITQDIADGRGTIGKLVKDSDAYLRVTAILSKVDTLMNDINHYGLLFQYDKHWQRIRTKKANLLTALKTPDEFKNYFQTETDNITTSLARLSILLEKAQNVEDKEKILNNTLFKKDFAELLRQVEELLDSVKLYNEDLVENLN